MKIIEPLQENGLRALRDNSKVVRRAGRASLVSMSCVGTSPLSFLALEALLFLADWGSNHAVGQWRALFALPHLSPPRE